jgi:hypothetical protein
VSWAILQSEDKDLTNQDVTNATRPDVDWKEVQTAVRVKAWRGYKAGLYPQQDLRDIEQTLSLYVLERLDRFDSERGSLATFLKHALKGGIADISRRSSAACRSLPDDVDMEPFDSMVDTPDGPPAELCQTLTQEDLERRTGGDSRSSIEQFEFAHDVDCVIALMTLRQQRICRSLMVHGIIKAQKRSGLTRMNFNHAVSDIAAIFVANDYDLRDVIADE